MSGITLALLLIQAFNMEKTKQYLSIIRALVFISIALAILILSLVPQPPEIITDFELSDKIMHLIAYITLAFSMGFILPSSFSTIRTILSVVIISSLYGALIEFLQGFTGRTPEGLDLVFDTIGAAIGIFLYFVLKDIEYKYHKKR